MKSFTRVIIAVALCFAIGGIVGGCSSGNIIKGDPKKELQRFFPTEFLENAKLVYHYKENEYIVSPDQYVIYKLDDPPNEFLETYKFKQTEIDFYDEWRLNNMEKFKIPQKYRLDFEKQYLRAEFSREQGYGYAVGYYYTETMELAFYYNL